MNKSQKIIAGSLITIALLAGASTSFASYHSGSGLSQTGLRGGGMFGGMNTLTDEEKTAFSTMTDAERKTFMDTKRAEQKVKMEVRETVIDKLLAGESLSSEEETIRTMIIAERATAKANRSEIEAKMEQVKPILEKKKNGETLTTEEQALLYTIHENRPDGKRGHRMMR